MDASRQSYIWEGIYHSFRDVKSSQQPHNDGTWTEMLLESLSTAVTSLKNDQPIPGINTDEKNLLPFLVSVVSQQRGEPVSIVDFGGGIGVDFLIAAKCAGKGSIGKYFVVETEKVCEHGARVFENEPRIEFCTEVPRVNADIVYVDSALQYIEPWRDLLRQFASCQPEYVLFVRIAAGNNPPYVSAQMNIPGNVIPYSFLNAAEVTEVMLSLGYVSVFSSHSNRTYDQSNFPPAYRLGTTRTMLFKRNAQ